MANKRKKKRERDPGEMTDAERAQFDAQDREKWESSARHIIESEDVLALFEREISKVIAGEALNAKLLLLVGSSRMLDKPMHAAIKGTSAGGKSELRKRVLAFFPTESVISFTSLTEKALIYDRRNYRHCILSMAEAAATEEQSLQDYLLRELISEGRILHSTAIRIGSEIVGQTIDKEGPVAFMVTTTKGRLHPENETRLLSLEIDDSEHQTRAVLKKVAQVEGLNNGDSAIDYAPWHDFQRWLEAGTRSVVVLFADALALAIPPASVRLRRDFGQTLRAIKAHALLHRRHREIDEQGCIVADIENDYATVRDLMNALIAESSGVAVKDTVQQTIDAVKLATVDLAKDEGATAQAVAKLLKLDPSAAWRRLRSATAEGFLVNLETRARQPGRYRATGQQIEAVEILPPPDVIQASLGTAQTTQTRKRTDKRQAIEDVSVCGSVCTFAPFAEGDKGADDADAFDERAAILEYDGGLTRDEAEDQAAEEYPSYQYASTGGGRDDVVDATVAEIREGEDPPDRTKLHRIAQKRGPKW